MPEPRTKELEKENLIGFIEGLERENFSIVKILPVFYSKKEGWVFTIKPGDVKASDLKSQLESGKGIPDGRRMPFPSRVYLDNPEKGVVYISAPQPDHWGNYRVSVAIYDTDPFRTRKYAPLSEVIPEVLMEFLKIPESG